MFACQLGHELQQAGHEIHLLVLFGKDPHVLPWSKKTFHLRANEKKRWFDFSGYRRLGKIIRSGDYDIVQANAGDTLRYVIFSQMLLRSRSVIVFRNANKISEFINTIPKKLIYSLLMRSVDHVASVSETCRLDIIRLFPFLKNRSTTLPIGVSTGSLYSDGRLVEKRQFLRLIQIGGFVPEKNHTGMLRIFKQLLKVHPEAELWLAGEGRLMNTIRQQAEQTGISGQINFLGSRKDILMLLPQCDALVMPSLIEGLPGVILEAFECGVPVIAYDVGGIHEVIKDRVTGRLVARNDEAGFMNALLELYECGNSEMIKNARSLVRREYDNTLIATRFLDLYDSVLKQVKH
jgi:glycosyltransferase involved in cell wall biosynthesis